MTFDIEVAIYSLLGFGYGVYLFYSGFRDLKTKRVIENIPTSKINTGAVGSHVEIKGQIDEEVQTAYPAPLSGEPCLFFSIEIQEEVKTEKSSHWKTVDQFFSHDGFYLHDGSGARAMVYVEGAEIKRSSVSKKLQARSNQLSELPASLVSVLNENKEKLKKFKLKNSSWLFSKKIRFIEWCFFPREQIYVLGYVQSGIRVKEKIKLKLENFLSAKKQIEQNEALKSRFDQDEDGNLNPHELERGAKILGLHLQNSQKKEMENEEPAVKMIFRHHKGHPFVISNMKEKDLVKKMNWVSILKLFGGPALTLASLAFLISSIT